MLVWEFHCRSRSWHHRFTAILITYGLSLPLCPSGLMQSTHLMLCFTRDRVSIPKNWTSLTWRGQFECHDSGVMIVTSAHVSSNPSITMVFIHTLSFVFWSFIEVCQNIHFLFSIKIFGPSSILILSWIQSSMVFLRQALDFLIFLERYVLHSD